MARIVLTQIDRIHDDQRAVPQASRSGMTRLRASLSACVAGSEGAEIPVAAQIERLRGFLEPEVQRLYRSPSSRLRDVEQLEALASGSASRGRFLADLTLDPPSSTGDLAGP